jgi:hypothetical protein
MLDRTSHLFGDELQGDWTRGELLEMDARFVAAVEAAFQAGLESRAAARATVKSRLVVAASPAQLEKAIGAAWTWFWRDKDADVPFSAVVAFVRIRFPCVTAECVREGFERRRRSTSTSSTSSARLNR